MRCGRSTLTGLNPSRLRKFPSERVTCSEIALLDFAVCVFAEGFVLEEGAVLTLACAGGVRDKVSPSPTISVR